jgi:hypothetical protein
MQIVGEQEQGEGYEEEKGGSWRKAGERNGRQKQPEGGGDRLGGQSRRQEGCVLRDHE